MKKFLLSLATAFSFVLFLGSCTNEEDINNNGYSDKEKAKIETLMNLFDSYGWELDTTVSIEQRNKELLEMDYEKTKSFLEYMSNGIEFDNFEPTQQNEDNAPKALSNTRSTMTFPIYGSIYKHKYEMVGWCSKNSSGIVDDGKITGFHAI